MLNLNEIQHDALVEIFNIGVGQAAAALSSIVNEEVAMSVPSISFQNRAAAAQMLDSSEAGRICGVSQQYIGTFNTEAILIFLEDKSLEIVRLMVGDAISMEDLTEMEQEAMCEIGNIILNSCVGTLANMFGSELQGSLPLYMTGISEDILGTASGQQADALVLMLHINFILEKHQIHGYVAFLLDVSALHDLQQQVDRYLAKMLA